jgi:signal peptidase I
MSDEGAAWRERTGDAWMSGSGAHDGFSTPPWGPAEPAEPTHGLDDTQAIPGLGTAPGPPEQKRPDYTRPDYVRPEYNRSQYNGTHYNGTQYNGTRQNGTGQGRPGLGSQQMRGQQQGAWAPQDTAWQPQDTAWQPQDTTWEPQGGWNRDAKDGRDTKDSGADLGAGPGNPGTGVPGGGAHRRKPKRRRSFWRELPVLVVVALVLALVIKSFAIQAFFIPSSSMENTLEINDRVLINKIVYHLRPIHRGDIIVFDGTGSWDPNNVRSSNIFSKAVDELEGIVGISHDSSIYIKRVIGLPGDHVKCCNRYGQMTVNGTPLHEGTYLYPLNQPSATDFSITVPAGRLWVMGDHRAVSYDSRGHTDDPGGGTIPESAVLGRAFVIIWPPSRWGFLNIPATFEEPKLNAPPAAGGNAAAGGSSAALAAAMDNGTPVRPATSPLPLALGFIGAVPITWLQRKARNRRTRRREAKGQ